MRAVTQRFILAALAVAKGDLFLFLDRYLLRRKASSLMATVAERLLGRQSTGAPEVISGFEFKNGGFRISNFWCIHPQSLSFSGTMSSAGRLLSKMLEPLAVALFL